MKKTLVIFTLLFTVGLLSTTLLVANAQTSSTSSTSITLYAGNQPSGSSIPYGYGLSSDNIVSPGPTLNLQEGTTYTVTVNNVADIPHSFEIVPTKAVSNSPMFGAGIDITNYISPGGSGSVTFTPDQTGNFYYVCTVPGHISLGMWGNVVVSAAVPEFPSALMLVFMALAATALVAFVVTKNKSKKLNAFFKGV